jgi:hypothetical protein
MGVSYDREQTAKAKKEKLHLVTLDINGKYAKRSGVNYQGFLFTDDQVEEAWKFFKWLASRKSTKQKANKTAKKKRDAHTA